MNRLCMTSLLALLAAGASAQANAPAKPATPGVFPARVNMRANAIKEFDKDGDGKLSDEERKTMMDEMQKRRPNAGPQFQEMMKKFDKDGDGKLSDDERKTMREARMKAKVPGQPKPPAADAK